MGYEGSDLSRSLRCSDHIATKLRFRVSVIGSVYVPHQAILEHMEGTQILTNVYIALLYLCDFCFLHLSQAKNEACDYLYLRLPNECVQVGEKTDIVFTRNTETTRSCKQKCENPFLSAWECYHHFSFNCK